MFTVKQLARIAGVTPRTLHYYDEIGLLKPSQKGDNGYRYYGEEALFRLQQILLYRELGMPLQEIQHILDHADFDVVQALEQHKSELRKRVRQLTTLIQTVDRTLSYLKGETNMSQKQIFEGFSDAQQAEYEKEAMQMYDPDTVKASNQKWKSFTDDEKKQILAEGKRIYQDLADAIAKGPASPEAQTAVEHWRQHLEYFWSPSDEALIGLADLYTQDERFKGQFDQLSPLLTGFIRDAVQIYVDQRKKHESTNA